MLFLGEGNNAKKDRLQTGRSVVVLGNHPNDGFSMQRYTRLIEAAYKDLGFRVQLARPPRILSRYLKPGKIMKFAIYVESFILFPVSLLQFLWTNSSFHISDHSNSIWCLIPWIRNAKITCHDLFAVRAALGEIPEYKPKLLGKIYQFLVLGGLQRAELIVCVSKSTESDVLRLVKSAVTVVIYNPLDHNVTKISSIRNRPSYGQYLLIVGSSGWRKNRAKALSVWVNMRFAVDKDIELVVVGPNLSADEIKLIPDSLKSSLHQLLNVEDAQLSSLYRESLGLILASKYEGFGWPVAECNAHARLVICNDIPVLREIGPGNIFLHDNSSKNWTEVYAKLLSDEQRRAVQVFASRYNWGNYLEGFRKIV
jgi:glycosyltransferase involved in cell wall biosynthesis